MRAQAFLALTAAAMLAACGQQPAETATKEPASAPDMATCADGSPKLALSGLCAVDAEKMMLTAASAAPMAMDGCAWRVGETEMPGGDVLIYRALTCGDHATKLEFAGGAERGELQLTASAMSGALPEPFTVGYVYTAEGEPAEAVTARARSVIEDPAEAAKCAARPAKIEGWPTDAMVVDTDPNGSSSADGSPVAVCGDLGYFDEGTRFWRVSQGYAWFFDFGQDLVEIDPGSITLLPQGDGGAYQVFQP